MIKKYLLVVFLIGSFILSACSSPNTPAASNDQPSEEQQEQVVPTEIESMVQEPTAAESQQQTPTTAQNTEPLTEELQDTESRCYHPYFPIIEGASWTYDAGMDEDYTLRIEETDEESFRMVQEMLDEDVIYAVDWYCTEDGILSGSFGQLDLLNQAAGGEETAEFQFETLEWEGETLPAPELLDLGYTWTSNYQLSANFDIEGFSESFEVGVSIDHEIVAIEEITVPAGTFSEAIRVDSIGEINMDSIFGENSSPFGSFDFGYSTWYVEGLGMVKTSSEISGYSTGVSLTSSSLLD